MPDPYQQRTEANATATAAQAAAIVAAFRAGHIDRPELPTWLATTIRAGAARAVNMADRALSQQLAAIISRPVPVVGLVLPPETSAVISQGVATVVEDTTPSAEQALAEEIRASDEELDQRIDRLAKAVPLDAGQEAHQLAMQRQGVEGWTRETDDDPCPLCIKLADGKVIGIDKKMIRHPGCSCVAVPVLTGAEPFQPPESGPLDPADFVPRTLTTGHGIGGRSYTQVRPGLKVSRSVFVPARRAAR